MFFFSVATRIIFWYKEGVRFKPYSNPSLGQALIGIGQRLDGDMEALPGIESGGVWTLSEKEGVDLAFGSSGQFLVRHENL